MNELGKLYPNFNFTVEHKMGNLLKISLFTFQMYHNERDITINFKNLAMNQEKHVFHWEK